MLITKWPRYFFVEIYKMQEEFQKCIDFIEKAIKIIVRIMIITNIVFIQSVQQENQNGR